MATADFFRSSGGSDPFSEMRRLQDEVNRLFSSSYQFSPSAAFPAVNAYANEDGIALTAQLPGVTQDDLEISVFRDTLTLRGRRQPEAPDRQAYHRRERGQGEFVRNISLPFSVDSERVEATIQDGVLRISLHRPEEDKPKRIRVSGQG
jgi:HSP20 family protein